MDESISNMGNEPTNELSLQLPKLSPSTAATICFLPFDIFQIIITMSLESPGWDLPFAVSHVCRIWRDYIFAMPPLDISQNIPQWEMLEFQLEKSGQAPLDIYIDRWPFFKSSIGNLRRITRTIYPHMKRWRSLHLEGVPYKIRRIFLDRIWGSNAPLLERIQVRQNSYYNQRLALKNMCSHWNAKNIFVGFPNLTFIEWTSPSSDIGAFPKFRDLKYLNIGDGTLDNVTLPFIQLIQRILSDSPLLRTLQICHGQQPQSIVSRTKLQTVLNYPPRLTSHCKPY
ncbi:hypothetical protein FRC04_002217 [Tulasnella sp. 424]|nr:hypothetical protein FRC04_002217 [Tulasnella sp. 424]KAG8967763.1 hypothetical protein FRC05_001942 [Tulasnella sp. 425]